MSKEYDLVILGGGTGGYVAAIRAAQLGMTVAIVENEKVGGTCLHKGCIPSKALLKSANLYREMKHSSDFGIIANDINIDFEKVQANKSNVIKGLYQGVQGLLKKSKVEVYQGHGRILGPSIFSPLPGTISVEHEDNSENTMLIPKHLLVATGSEPKALPNISFDNDYVLSSDGALEMTELPESMLIIGGGVIGIEWASLLTDLGVKVTVVEAMDSILPLEDKMIQKEIKKQLSERGVTFKIGDSIDVDTFKINNEQVSIQLSEAKETLTADKMLVSVGRAARTKDIGLNNTDIETERDFIKTNEFYQTKNSHIYAIGDCIGGMQLAHVASKEGIIAVEHMADQGPLKLDDKNIPSCVYSHPEAAKIGWTEHEAKEAGYKVKTGKVSFQSIGKAHVNGYKNGSVKIITDEDTNDLLGVHIVGDHATELIAEASLAKILDATAWEISQTIHPHPTLSEIIGEAAMAVNGEQIHG